MERFRLCLALLALPFSAMAHHSPVNFRFDTMLEFEGTVLSHEYRNPHVFLTIETTNDAGETEEWLLAASSVSNLRRAGWTADSFSAGDHIAVRGNPDRNPDKLFLYLEQVTDPQGTVYYPRTLPPGGQRPLAEQTFTGSVDFVGVWQPDFSKRDLAAGFQAAELPLTDRGQAAIWPRQFRWVRGGCRRWERR